MNNVNIVGDLLKLRHNKEAEFTRNIFLTNTSNFVSCWKEDDDFYWLKIRIIVPNKPSSSYDALLRFKYVYELQKAFDLYKVKNKQD